MVRNNVKMLKYYKFILFFNSNKQYGMGCTGILFQIYNIV